MMSLLLYSALLAHCSIGLLVHAQIECVANQKYLDTVQVELQKLEILFNYKVKWFKQFCNVDDETINRFILKNPPNYGQPPENVNRPRNISFVIQFPEGSLCNPERNDQQNEDALPTYPTWRPYPADVDPQTNAKLLLPLQNENSPTWRPYPTDYNPDKAYPTYNPGQIYDPQQNNVNFPTYQTSNPYPSLPTYNPGQQYPPPQNEGYPPAQTHQTNYPYPSLPTYNPEQQYPPQQNQSYPPWQAYPTSYPYSTLPTYNSGDQKAKPSYVTQLTSEYPHLPVDGVITIFVECPFHKQYEQLQLTEHSESQAQTEVSIQFQDAPPPIANQKPPLDFTDSDINADSHLSTVQLIVRHNYPVETHYVTTEDGYVLSVHRIPRPGAKVVLLVHGLMSSSACWVQMGPTNGLGYILYDQGYDVWLLNTRGNIYSQNHVDPHLAPSEYWAFSFHEIGIFDLPATIDQIQLITAQPYIQYIGHSQGSTAFFVMASELPEYAKKVTFMQALSPTVYMQNTNSPVLRFLSLFKRNIRVLLNLVGGFSIANDNKLIKQFRDHICENDQMGSEICRIFDFVLCGFGWNEFNSTFAPVVAGHSSQGASAYQIYHYSQLLNNNEFSAFDNGEVLNLQEYDRPSPPPYNLTQISCKVAIHHSEDDWLATLPDVTQLKNQLSNVVDYAKISQDGFSHYDYLLSQNVQGLVYDRLVSNCAKYGQYVTYQ
ncbi:lipase 1-like isoform X2 [Drosophila hydei]|uniref:Lipase 1-like isoform X2 n=1 Tax=Drosophila hydei TaxID=7224 RepID=A0A6J1LZM9_DROHY|nr:lipase 1-like isoform X2 [Drosophila hydei]